MRRQSIMLFAVILCAALIAGCAKAQTYGGRLSGMPMTPIKDIIRDPGRYEGSTVAVMGRVDTECNTGCWFYLKDKESSIYVDIEPAGFAIPQKVGSIAVVEGSVSVVDRKIVLTGKAVKIL